MDEGKSAMVAEDLGPGRILGRYELLAPIARGGMAQVWAARLHGTRGFQRIVALKTILGGSLDDSRVEQMFLEEASFAARIQHSNIATTLDLGEENGLLYLVMEWVDGEPLTAILEQAHKTGPMPLEIAVNLIGQVCQGLHFAHELHDEQGAPLGLVHRDVSPQNVLVSYGGTAKLVDFGIAKAVNRNTGLTDNGEVKGKFAYMAPEQVRGEAIDRRADIFAVGILLYLLTTGRHPYKAANPAETIRRLCSSTRPIAPSSLRRDYPFALQAIVLRALEQSRDKRFSTAQELFEGLVRAVPDAFEAGFETDVARYLGELLGDRGTERRAGLRQAQQKLDSARLESGTGSKVLTPGSGSLRGMTFDSNSDTSDPGRDSDSHHTLVSGRPAELLAASKRRSRGRIALIAAAVAAFVAAAVLVPRLTSQEKKSASMAPAFDSPLPQPPATPVPVVERPAPPPASAAKPEAETPDPLESDVASKPGSKRRRAAFRPPQPGVRVAKPDNAADSRPAENAGAPVASPSPARTGPDAWDPKTFGGRN